MKEEPNTKFYFDRKIARVVFEDDEERKAYWFDITDLHPNLHRLHHLRHYFHHSHYHFLLPIEEWLKENNMNYVEDDMVLFKMRWL